MDKILIFFVVVIYMLDTILCILYLWRSKNSITIVDKNFRNKTFMPDEKLSDIEMLQNLSYFEASLR